MRQTTDLFTVGGKPMLVPDEPVQIFSEDLQSPETGRDESGVLHRFILRHQMLTWKFTYRQLTEAEKAYMESLFPDGESFTFSHPGRLDSHMQEESICCRSDSSACWRNARTGLWENCTFRITQC